MSQYKIEAGTGQHIGDRREQQDRTALLAAPKAPGYMLAVMADGMGGTTGGALAAEQVIHTASQVFERFSPLTDTPEDVLRTIAAEADTVIKLAAISSEKKPHSTVVLLLIQPQGKAIWAHAGDSRLYRFRGPNCVIKTEDHTYLAQLAAQNRLKEHHLNNPAAGSLLVNYLGGTQRNLKLSLDHCEGLAAGDSFLLCTDGLWQYFSDAELGAIIAMHAPRQACEFLINKARSRASGINADNCTLAIVKFSAVETPTKNYAAKPMGSAI